MIDTTARDVIRWAERPAALEFDFAGRRIGAAMFTANVCTTPFIALEPHPDDDVAIAQMQQRGTDASVFYSHPVQHRVPRITIFDEAIRYAPRHFFRYWVDTVGSFEAYLGRLSPKTRQTLRRKVRRYGAFAGDEAPWREFRTIDELRVFHTLARPLSSRTYQERLLDAGLPASAGYMERLHATGGTARGFILYHGDRPVAYLYTPVRNGRAVYKFLGYDTDYAAWSPGLVLQHLALSSMFGDPEISMLDFTEGEGQHKSVFATGQAFCADLYYFRRTLKTALAVPAHIALRHADAALMHVLRGTGMHGRMRRRMRRRAGAAS